MNDDATLGTTIPLPEPPIGWFDYDYSVLMDGTLALIRTDLDIHAETAHWRARVKRGGTPARPAGLWSGRARLSTFDGRVEGCAMEVPLGRGPIVDRLADGRWLMAASLSSHGETNAVLYAADGAPAGALAIGDGVSHVRCAPDGTIWVGYSDEGAFAMQGGDEGRPISSFGIARFAPDGRVLWAFNAEEGGGPFIADCYALTLDGNTLWSCYYSGFPVVRVEDGALRHWSNGIKGATALATDADHVLLAGGYDDQAGRIALLRLDDDSARQLGESRFVAPPRDVAGLVQGQGAILHIVGPAGWRQISIYAVCAALRS